MTARSCAPLLAAIAFVATACSRSPTEPTPVPGTGTLIIATQCTVRLPVQLFIDGGAVGSIATPGESRFRLSAGLHSHGYLCNGAVHMPCGPGTGSATTSASGCSLNIPDGGVLRLVNPPTLCGLSTLHP